MLCEMGLSEPWSSAGTAPGSTGAQLVLHTLRTSVCRADTHDSLHANGDGKCGPAEHQWESWTLDLAVGFQSKGKPSLVQCRSPCSLGSVYTGL